MSKKIYEEFRSRSLENPMEIIDLMVREIAKLRDKEEQHKKELKEEREKAIEEMALAFRKYLAEHLPKTKEDLEYYK